MSPVFTPDEIRRRALIQLIQRAQWKQAIRAELFGKQLSIHDDKARFRACHAGRRSGKSEFIPRAALLDLLDTGFDETVVILAETGKKAKELHWRKIQALITRHDLPFTSDKTMGAIHTPWGSSIVFLGLADDGAVELLRGYKLKALYADETATYAGRLKVLVEVVEPALGDTDGSCTLVGTPSRTMSGYWYEICSGKIPGWSVSGWHVRDNPKFPKDAENFLAQVRKRNGWDENNATYQIEYLGIFANDANALVYKYFRPLNSAEALPVDISLGHVTIACDYGTTKDPCAWVVIWSKFGTRDIYVLESRKLYNLLPDQAAAITKHLCDVYKPSWVVGDPAGAAYIEQHNRLYGELAGCFVHPAIKLGKVDAINILNGEFQSERIKLLPAAEGLACEMEALPWKNDKKLEEHPGKDNHNTDCLLYAVRSHFTELPKPEAAKPTPEQLEALARAERGRQAQEAMSVPWFSQTG